MYACTHLEGSTCLPLNAALLSASVCCAATRMATRVAARRRSFVLILVLVLSFWLARDWLRRAALGESRSLS